ncbi:mechanosensitive ion channel family protein [Alphaproteobacteria bacterium]|nr:mechanosensitive ion channel family protein [Alphaproteobacteria bacterium]
MNLIENLFSQILFVFQNDVLGISLVNFGIILLSLLFALLIRGVIAKLIVNKVKKLVQKTGNKIDDKLFDALLPPFKLLPIVLVFLSITLYFDIESTLGLYFQKINNTLSTIFVFWLIHQSLIPFSNIFHKLEGLLSKALVLWMMRSIKYLIIFLGIVAVLEVWGIKLGPVIAGLGLFGVAVALGAQDLFKNLISGIMILLEKRFHIGDVINVPGHTEGTVEHIGFRSTLIRKFDSTPITIPNYIFAEAPILNYTNRVNRRINWTIGLEYNSTLEQIKDFTKNIDNFIKNNTNFIVDENYKSFVRIDKFNDSSIDILIYCFTSTNDWEQFLEIKEELASKIKNVVEELGLNFAFPSISIYKEKID